MTIRRSALVFAIGITLCSSLALGQAATSANLLTNLKVLTETPAVSGYESDLNAKIQQQLSNFSLQSDNVGNLMVTRGAGAPHRLIVTSIDEPGFVVSGITPDGYLRVQRLPQGGLSPLWNELHSTQPMLIRTRDGHWANAIDPQRVQAVVKAFAALLGGKA